MTKYERVQNALRARVRKVVVPVISRVEKPLYAHGILSVGRRRLPDFICIGAMKAGTTWLYENLRCHPDVYLPDRKEDYFFSHDFYRRSLLQYSRRFVQGGGRLKGEITPGYGILTPDRIQFIHSIMPDIKLIFLLRDPVYRTWSEACMNLATKKQRKVEEVARQEFLNYFDSDPCRQRSDYVAILDNWIKVFPRDCLLLGLYEDIEYSPMKLFKDVLMHLDISTDVNFNNFPLNKVIAPKYEDYGGVHRGRLDGRHIRSEDSLPDEFLTRLVQRYSRQAEILNERFGVPTHRWSCGIA